MLRNIFVVSLLVVTQGAFAESFSGKQFSLGTEVIPGSLLECDTPDALTLERLSPKTYEWAMAAGLIEKSLISGTSGYSNKITTKNSLGQRALFVGCWVTKKIVSENVNGVEMVFAQGAYQINNAVKESPIMSLAVCKKKKQYLAYTQGDYTIEYENPHIPCKTTQWNERLPSLAALERQTAYFQLRKARGKKGYFRSVGF